MSVNTVVDAGGVIMKNPVASASGTAGYGEVFAEVYGPEKLGALVTKGISLKPRTGNPPPRIAETPCGMLNAIGLENVGLAAFEKEKLPYLAERNATVVVNFFGESEEEYAELAERLSALKGVHGLEMNISCPNVERGGMEFGSEPSVAGRLVSMVRKACRLPLWVKLSPNVRDIKEMALSVEESGADAITLVNTLKGMAVDIETGRPLLATVAGGLSGPAIKPVALRMVYEAAGVVKIPVIGAGGIANANDAIEFIIAGASAVQVGTAAFVNPMMHLEIISGIENYLEKKGLKDISKLVGSIKLE